MHEINLQNMTRLEAYELDGKLAYCAAQAFIEAIEDKENYEDGVDISSEGIDALYSSYAKSMFARKNKNHKEHVKERLRTELNRRIPSNDPVRQELLLPIMAYALIVSNEYNVEAIRKRIRKDTKRKKPQDREEYPYNRWKHVNPYVIVRSETPIKSDTFERKLDALKAEIIGSRDYAYCGEYHVVFAYTLLKNYRSVVRCQDVAQIALFLRRLLTASHCDSIRMNSLIRLYLANHLDNILIRSYVLCEESVCAAATSGMQGNYLLSHYHNYFADDGDGNSLNQHGSENYSGRKFAEIYQDLISNYSISEGDLNMLLDFYLDSNTLEGYANLLADTKRLVGDIINRIRNRVEIPNTALTNAMVEFVLCSLRKKEAYPTLRLRCSFRGEWTGKRIDRSLCVARIPKHKIPEAKCDDK